MKDIELYDNGITFEEESHRYFKDVVDTETGEIITEELYGITSTIIKWMFPETYEGISDEVLQRAADHGHYVHSCIEMTSVIGATEGCPESQEFIDMMKEHDMKVLAHEYIVTAYGKFASPIDVVMQDKDGGIWLGDIKTTSSLHEPKVRLQLSIYAMFFEMNNPDLKVKGIVEIWLPRQQYRTSSYNGWQELKVVPAKDVEETIKGYFATADPQEFLPLYTMESQLPAQYHDIIYAIAEQEKMAKSIKQRTDEMKAALLQAFEEYGVKKFETPDVVITRILPSTRKTVDSKKLKDDYPDVYSECMKESTTSASIKITLR